MSFDVATVRRKVANLRLLDPWEALVVEFLYSGLLFCEAQSFDDRQTDAVCEILNRLVVATFGDRCLARDESYEIFKDLVLDHFDHFANVDPFADFVSTTLYRHFHAYSYCYVTTQPHQLDERTIVVETPLRPLPLHGARLLSTT